MKLVKVWVKVILILILITFKTISQPTLPQTSEKFFRSPVNYPFLLSGNFGELRETHFHAGIDIKPSNSSKPDKIYSVADGFISRIMVGPGGYGRAVYIDHPNTGYTSVYGHLSQFNTEIEKIARQQQMANESFAVDFKLSPEQVPIIKGMEIGLMGNAGFSFGTHLHFELRDTKTEKPVNPLLFDFVVQDNIPPSILSISAHGLDPDFYKLNETLIDIPPSENNVSEIPGIISIPAWRMGISVNAFDRHNGASNKNGIYSLNVYVDNISIYNFQMDKISFEQSKNIIGFYDFEKKKSQNKTYVLCYKYPGNNLEFLNNSGNGIISLFAGKERTIRLEIEDFHKNKRIVIFSVKRSEEMKEMADIFPYSQKINVGDIKEVTEKNCTINFDVNSLFRNISLKFSSEKNGNNEWIYKIHQVTEPIKTPIKIAIKPFDLKSDKKSKAIVVYQTEKGSRISLGGVWQDSVLVTKIRNFGKYAIAYDTFPPSIKSIDFTSKVGKKTKYRFTIKDNYSTQGEYASELKYKVWIDDLFTISPLRQLNNVLEVPISHLKAGKHILKIEAKDHSGNTAYFTSEFTK